MSYPKMVYHKDYPFDANDHEREAEAKRERLARLAKSDGHLKSFGPDWYSVDDHPGRKALLEKSKAISAFDDEVPPYVEEEEDAKVIIKKPRKK